MDHAIIIDRLGGATQVARRLGLTVGAVQMWKQRRAIPPKHWLAIVRLSREWDIPVTYAGLSEASPGMTRPYG